MTWEVIPTFDRSHIWRPFMDSMKLAVMEGHPDVAVYYVHLMAKDAAAAEMTKTQWKEFIDAWDLKVMQEAPPENFKAYRLALTKAKDMTVTTEERLHASR